MARKPAVRLTVRLTANFERNLADIERFLTEAEAPQAYDALLDELLDTVIPNLERNHGVQQFVQQRVVSLGQSYWRLRRTRKRCANTSSTTIWCCTRRLTRNSICWRSGITANCRSISRRTGAGNEGILGVSLFMASERAK